MYCQIDKLHPNNNNPDSLVECEALTPIPFGHINYQIVDTTIVQPGDLVIYSCDTLYTLSGQQHRICLRNGSWSGVEPICIGESSITPL